MEVHRAILQKNRNSFNCELKNYAEKHDKSDVNTELALNRTSKACFLEYTILSTHLYRKRAGPSTFRIFISPKYSSTLQNQLPQRLKAELQHLNFSLIKRNLKHRHFTLANLNPQKHKLYHSPLASLFAIVKYLSPPHPCFLF